MQKTANQIFKVMIQNKIRWKRFLKYSIKIYKTQRAAGERR